VSDPHSFFSSSWVTLLSTLLVDPGTRGVLMQRRTNRVSRQYLGAAQMLIEKQGKFWMDRSDLEHQSVEFRNLFVLVNAQAAGKLLSK